MNKAATLVISVLVLGGAAATAYFFWPDEEKHASTPALKPAPAMAKTESEAPQKRYPIAPRPKPETVSRVEKTVATETVAKAPPPPVVEPLPTLDSSDPKVTEELAPIVGLDRLSALFNVDNFIRRIVVTVDNLPRRQVPPRYLPTTPIAGRFQALGEEEGKQTLSGENYDRYSAYVALLESADVDSLIATYSVLYPLFQEAYEDLGYPDAYFNDRVVEAIDDLLEAPELYEPIKLVRPSVMFKYADPELEQLSAGQKVLIRMGPNNAARVKVKLRQIRHELTRSANMAAGSTGQR